MAHICIVSQYFIPDIGGAVTRLVNLLKILNSLDHEVTIVTTVPHYPNGDIPINYRTRWKFIEKSGNITVIRIRMPQRPHNSFLNRLINYFSFVFLSISALPLLGKIDLIWVTSPNFFGNFTGVIYKVVKRIPLILNVDDFWPDVVEELGIVTSRLLLKISDFANLFVFNYCDYITPISLMIKKKLITKYHVNPTKIYVIEVGVDYPRFMQAIHESKEGISIKQEKRHFSLSDPQPLIVYSGVLGPAYDFELLLKATKKLETEVDTFQLIIHGDGPLKPFIETYISKIGLKRTKLLTNHLTFNDYMNFLLNAFIFVLPMKKGVFSETAIPAKLFTYLMLDKPIISTKGGNIEIILKESNAGFAVPHNYKSLTQALKLLLKDDVLYTHFCGNGSKYARSHFDLKVIKKKVKSLFIELK